MSKQEAFSSQYGEDEFLVTRGQVAERGTFIDVGAGDPVRFSNTYYLEQLGWAGVCIDADPKQVEALRRVRTSAVEWAAITPKGGEIELFQCEDSDYSTTLEHLPGLAVSRGWDYSSICVPAMRLETILEKHGIGRIDLLSIDTEGSELEVCDTLDWEKHRPRVIVIEYVTAEWRPSNEAAIRDYFARLPYRLVHRTTANLIFDEHAMARSLRRRVEGRRPANTIVPKSLPDASRGQSADLNLPTISIVTPSFNRKEFLADALNSVLAQKYPKLEYVVVDGGSTDGSAELILARADELAWSVSEPDGGAWEAINKGFAHTSGEVMGWLGSDDLLMPWALSTVGELFARFSEVEWLTTRFPLVCDEDGRAVACAPRDAYSERGFFRGENLPEAGWPARDFIMQEGTFWRRSLWERTGGHVDDSLMLAADFELWARFFRSGATLYCVETPLAGFRWHGNQKSQNERAAYIEEARWVFFRYGGRPPTGAAHLPRRIAQRLLSESRRRRLRGALERFIGLPGPPQGPIIVHLGPGQEWSIRRPDEPTHDEPDSAD